MDIQIIETVYIPSVPFDGELCFDEINNLINVLQVSRFIVFLWKRNI